MSDMPDLSKIVGLIMENPELISQIKNLASEKTDSESTLSEKTSISEPSAAKSEKSSAESPEKASGTPAPPEAVNLKKRRRELLTALKPYVTEERSRAIDTMLSVIDVIDVMRER